MNGRLNVVGCKYLAVSGGVSIATGAFFSIAAAAAVASSTDDFRLSPVEAVDLPLELEVSTPADDDDA